LFYLFGTVGAPVAAYNCVDCDEVGVVSFLSWSPKSCYAEACCDGEQDSPEAQIQSNISCCDLEIQIASDNTRMLLPGNKYGPAEPLPDTPALFDTSQPDVRISSESRSGSPVCLSINLPLLI
jgi:hypothetical protein